MICSENLSYKQRIAREILTSGEVVVKPKGEWNSAALSGDWGFEPGRRGRIFADGPKGSTGVESTLGLPFVPRRNDWLVIGIRIGSKVLSTENI